MAKHLVIVESPSKAKTIEKYLGKDYKVVSSKGHIRDLSKSGKERLGIDIENNFAAKYTILRDKKDTVKELQALAKKYPDVILASDPDREGEAIAWHLAQVLDLDLNEDNRVTFNEITKPVVLDSIEKPHKIDMDLVRSQEARRMLDRIIGFKLSSLLRKKIHSRSAGRVQSVALRLIVEKENEIKKFKPKEYWTIDAKLKKGNSTFMASLIKVDGKSISSGTKNKTYLLNNQMAADEVLARIKDKPFVVSQIKTSKKETAPKPAFITSTLQQTASAKLGYGAKKTMTIAQKLYEGLDIAGTPMGLITYMRTDSTRLSDLFVQEAQEYIESEYGKEYVGKKHVKNDAKAQDAHEAIRPTSIANTPEYVKPYLTNEQFRLYSLIYYRTIASLMKNARFESTKVLFECENTIFQSTGQIELFDGYLKAYGKYEKASENKLPKLSEGTELMPQSLDCDQHFTEPPARFTEARLIKELEDKGIGRPSTYATIIDTLQKRGYVSLERTSETSKTRFFVPTEQGVLTHEKLKEFFDSIINVEYTADMEKNLDIIAEGDEDSIHFLQDFYADFSPLVENAYEKMPEAELESVGRACPECGSDLVYRQGRFGKFISCSTYPTCKYTENADDSLNEFQDQEIYCPNCNARMVIKKGRFGPFWACPNYPECKTIVPLKQKAQPKKTGEICPECGSELVERMSRYGKPFVGCSNYPKCRYIKKEAKKEEKE